MQSYMKENGLLNASHSRYNVPSMETGPNGGYPPMETGPNGGYPPMEMYPGNNGPPRYT